MPSRPFVYARAHETACARPPRPCLAADPRSARLARHRRVPFLDVLGPADPAAEGGLRRAGMDRPRGGGGAGDRGGGSALVSRAHEEDRMTTRREFVSAGIAFVGCTLFPHAHAQVRRREVVVAGKRVRTIDVHAHAIIPEAVALMKQKVAPAYASTMAERLKRMDEQGVDMQAL